MTDQERMTRLLTQTEVAERYRVHTRTISRWCARGELPDPIQRGDTKRWREQDLDDSDQGLIDRGREARALIQQHGSNA